MYNSKKRKFESRTFNMQKSQNRHRFFNSFRIIVLGFAGVILAGALLLMLPISSAERVVTPFIDTLFTSTTAVCVTGLVVRDTGTYWSIFGQSVILILIQIGGLGVITVAAAFAMIAGHRDPSLYRAKGRASHQTGRRRQAAPARAAPPAGRCPARAPAPP